MSEQQPNTPQQPQQVPDPLSSDPQFQKFQATQKANAFIGEYEKDPARKAILDAGLREALTERPEIVNSQGELTTAIDAYKRIALKSAQTPPPAPQPPVAPAQPPAQTPPPQGDPALQKTIGSASLKEIQNVGHTSLSNAVDAKVLGSKEGVINMS